MQKKESTLHPRQDISITAAKNWTAIHLAKLNAATLKGFRVAALTGIISLLCLTGANAGNWYVRPSSAGSGSGADWNNAWSIAGINWNSVQPGDTLWFAGGSYSSSVTVGKSGTAANRIYLKRVRATNSVPASATGWDPAFDSTVRINYFNVSSRSYITIDGQVEGLADGQTGANDYGIAMVLGNGANGVWGSGCDSIEVSNVQMIGPGWGDYCGYGIFLNGAGGMGNANHLISHVYIDGVIQQITVGEWKSGIIEYVKLYNAGTGSAAGCHSDSIYFSGCKNVTVRYSQVYNSYSQSLFFDNSGDSGMYFYGNIFDQGPLGSGTCIQTKQGYSHGDFHIYNNTFIGWGSSAVQFRGTHSGTSEVKNNIFWSTSWNVASDGSATVQADNNLYSGSKPGSDGASSIGSAANPFVSSSSRDYHLAAGSTAVNRGMALAVDGFINKDVDGNLRGNGGTWDIGAYEFGAGGPSTNPVMSVTPASLSFGTIASGTTKDLTVTVRNAGGGTLPWSATITPALANFAIVPSAGSVGSNQSQTVTVRYTATGGSQSPVIQFTGGGVATVSVSAATLAVLPGLSFESYAGVITAPFVTNSAGYISQPAETGVTDGGSAVYGFTITTAGSYVVSAMLNAPSDAANSLFVNIDGEPTDPAMIWDAALTTTGFASRTVSWRGNGTFDNPQYVPAVFNLSAGVHQLIVRGREGGVQLGRITIAPSGANPLSPPQNLRVASF